MAANSSMWRWQIAGALFGKAAARMTDGRGYAAISVEKRGYRKRRQPRN